MEKTKIAPKEFKLSEKQRNDIKDFIFQEMIIACSTNIQSRPSKEIRADKFLNPETFYDNWINKWEETIRYPCYCDDLQDIFEGVESIPFDSDTEDIWEENYNMMRDFIREVSLFIWNNCEPDDGIRYRERFSKFMLKKFFIETRSCEVE